MSPLTSGHHPTHGWSFLGSRAQHGLCTRSVCMFSFESCLLPNSSPCFPFKSCLVSYSSLCFTPLLVPGSVKREATNHQCFFLHKWCHSPHQQALHPLPDYLAYQCLIDKDLPVDLCRFWPKPVFLCWCPFAWICVFAEPSLFCYMHFAWAYPVTLPWFFFYFVFLNSDFPFHYITA